MVKKRNRLTTDALREVRATFSRFFSILVLAALAVAFLSGLRTTAPDMEYTADRYYDRTNFMDGYVLSTLGITEDDLAAIAALETVSAVEGAWTVDAVARDTIVRVGNVPQRLNLLEVTEGRLPERADECITEPLLLAELGLSIGDTLEISLDGEALIRRQYTIVGVADSPLYVGTDRGSSTLGTGSVDAYVFVPEENFDMDAYTAAYFTFEGMAALDSYSQTYEDLVKARTEDMEHFAEVRARLRHDTLVGNAQAELDCARETLDTAQADAEAELADAKAKLQDAREELDQGWLDYEEGTAQLEREIRNAKAKLGSARTALDETELTLEESKSKYAAGLAEYESGLASYEQNCEELARQQKQLDAGYAQYEAALSPYVDTLMYETVLAQLAPQKEELDTAQAQLDAGKAQLAAVKADLEEAKNTLTESADAITQAEVDIAAAWKEYNSGWTKLRWEEDQGRQELSDALETLETGEAEYADGLRDYETGRAEADEVIRDAKAELIKAQQEIDDIDECQWYVLSRYTNVGFVSYQQDAQRVSNLANVFPLIFFLVAALACLTTMTRMVEEQRTQIGALKAMGFSRWAISKKYIGYAFWASFLGGILGLALGGTLIPAVIANAFNIMYNIPGLEFKFQPAVCVLSVLAAVVCTTGAGLWACLSTLMDTPANLMRPKAPKAGKRVLLERVGFLWKRLSFTRKVTLRNLFRYKKRFWMTVLGIGGCTALIVTGFGLHESIFDILDKQFDEISLYDATVSLDHDLSPEALGEITAYLGESDQVERYLLTHQETADCVSDGPERSVTLFAVDDMDAFRQFVDLRHRKDEEAVHADDSTVLITEKLSELLGVERGNTITLEGEKTVSVTVGDIVENYVSHYVYLTDGLYETLFGHAAEQNTLLLAYGDGTGQAQSDEVSAYLMTMDGVTAYSYISAIRDTFTESMNAVNYAVIIIILAAAALAFVVLYNLTNINITERIRELATLKVLGFYDGEITAYVYRENIFLTLFGILLGIGMGKLLHAFLVLTVEVDLVMFGRTAPAYAYVLSAVLTAAFSVVVNIAAHFRLKKVDMVESLKTVE